MRIASGFLSSIKLIWGNLHIAGTLVSYGIFGVLMAIVVCILEVLVDVVGSVIGFVLMVPAFIFELILRLIFGRF